MGIQELIKENPLNDLDSYGQKMSISKVVKYFEKHGIFFTKTMIQNYIRVEVLPTPDNKRWYTKKHIIALYLINELKRVFSLDDLRKIIIPLFDKDDDFEYMTYLESFIEIYNNSITESLKKLDKTISSKSDNETKNEYGLMLTMAQAVATADVVSGRLS